MAAAGTGDITVANRPIEIVGRPSPIIPFARPARANTAPTKMSVESSVDSSWRSVRPVAMWRFRS